MCSTCDELREENAYLRRQLGLEVDEASVWQLRKVAGMTPGAAKVALALLETGNRPLGWEALDALQPETKCEERQNPRNQVSVMIWRVKKVLGPDSVINHWGKGWTLSEQGSAAMRSFLPDQAVAA